MPFVGKGSEGHIFPPSSKKIFHLFFYPDKPEKQHKY